MTQVGNGRYELVRELGSGSMGVVWLAHDSVLDRSVALKELRIPDGVEREEALERFTVEAQAAARLSHPSIVTVHDVFTEDDRVLMSLELLDGPTLAEVIAAGPLGSGTRQVMTGVASALAEAHRLGIVHRDLKPENVFLLPSGRVVVCDFGLARIGVGRGTHVGTVMGTPGYMSPEQIKGQDVGPSSDVFSWGAVAYELACGEAPFGDPTVEDFVTLSWRVANEPPAELVFEDDPLLWPTIATALAKDPADRFVDGSALVQALASGSTGAVVPPTTPMATAVSPIISIPPGATSIPSAGPVSVPPTPSSTPGGRTSRSTGTIIGIVAASVLVLALLGGLFVVLAGGSGDDGAELTAVSTSTTASADAPSIITTTSLATTSTTPTTAAGGPAGPGSPEWQTFIIQVASRPKGEHSRAEVEAEAAYNYGYASPELRVLESDPYYPAMNPGYWVIHAGPFPTRADAAAALARLSGALPGDAHVRHLDQNCPRAPCT